MQLYNPSFFFSKLAFQIQYRKNFLNCEMENLENIFLLFL